MKMLLGLALPLLGLFACGPATVRPGRVSTPDSVLRTAVLGCWALHIEGSLTPRSSELAPPRMRLDSTKVVNRTFPRARQVVLLDTLGNPIPRETFSYTGLATYSYWSADRNSDTVRFFFSDGLVGSQWALAARPNTIVTEMNGLSQAIDDVVRPTSYPWRASSAHRVPCL